LPHAMKSLLDGKDTSTVSLPRYGVAILRDAR
jgi:hypothetical protein